MTAPTVRADYDALGQAAGQFSQQSDNARQTLQKLKQAMDTLQGGDWVGQGATAFYAEMNSSVLPTMQRLVNALDNGASTAQAISKAMKEAEDAAARVFSIPATGLAQAPGGGSGSGGAGGGSRAGGGSGAGGAGGGSGSGGGAGGGAAAPAAVTDSIMNGTIKAANAPNSVTLPAVFDKGMQDAWKDSFPGGHEKEQGGLLVKNAKGDYEMIRGPAGTGGTWTPNYQDLGGNTYLGLAHTHPYDSGHVDVPYSDADIGFLFQPKSGHQAEIMTVQSGNTQFLLGRTEEFNQAMAGKTQAQIDTTVAEMTKLYNDTVAAQKAAGASFPDRYQAATKAVADKYHLIYYKGQNGNLTKQ